MPFPKNNSSLLTSNGFYTPDLVEIVYPKTSQQTSSGYISPGQSDKSKYQGNGVTFPAFAYLATGRFLSTQVAPSEYGDGDAADSLMILIRLEGKTEAEKAMIRPEQIIKLTRKDYTPEGKLYRLVTGNPYPDHVEYRVVALYD